MNSDEFTRLVLGSRLTIEDKKKAIAEDIAALGFENTGECESRRQLWVNRINWQEKQALEIEAVRGLTVAKLEAEAKLKAKPVATTIPPESSLAQEKKAKRERDLIGLLIEAAQDQCKQKGDARAVFLVLREWAKESPPRPPLIGVTETGIQWIDKSDNGRELSADSLRRRMRRQ